MAADSNNFLDIQFLVTDSRDYLYIALTESNGAVAVSGHDIESHVSSILSQTSALNPIVVQP